MKEIQLKNKHHHFILKVHKIRQIRSFHQSFKGSNRLHIIIIWYPNYSREKWLVHRKKILPYQNQIFFQGKI